ncbi:hypothetical protein [Sphingomonas yabuuchiae]|uniref:hypothetical protein n=1 Tax=Sphingomonas yabuuchiae TaxID=172044 RepID=UPI003AD9FA4B
MRAWVRRLRHRKYRDHWTVGNGPRITYRFAEKAAQVLTAGYPVPSNEGLRCRHNTMFRFESVNLGARRESMILDRIALAPQQILCLQAIWTCVFRHHHPVNGCLFG